MQDAWVRLYVACKKSNVNLLGVLAGHVVKQVQEPHVLVDEFLLRMAAVLFSPGPGLDFDRRLFLLALELEIRHSLAVRDSSAPSLNAGARSRTPTSNHLPWCPMHARYTHTRVLLSLIVSWRPPCMQLHTALISTI